MTEHEFNHQLISLEDNLLGFAYSLTLNKDDAKDLLQQTMLKALVHRDQFVYCTSLKSWTCTIMKNTFINSYRRNTKLSATFCNTTDTHMLTQKRDELNDLPDSAYASKEIVQIIDGLKDEFRIPFKMYVEGYKYVEISEKLMVKMGTIKSRIFIARKKLMNALKENYPTRIAV